MSLHVVILAAGQSKRMLSALPKALHTLAGKPLLEHVVTTARTLNPSSITVVYGHQGQLLREQLAHLDVQWIEQTQQLGTGHAALQALPHLPTDARVLILFTDVPLISTETLQSLIQATPKNALGLVTAKLSIPTGLGRVIRDSKDSIIGIVEEKDANDKQRLINEIFPGMLLCSAEYLKKCLPTLTQQNAQGEYYLTELVSLAAREAVPVTSVLAKTPEEVQGINDRVQLANLERYYQKCAAEKLMLAGVTLIDPTRFDLRGTLQAGKDVSIDINVVIEGTVSIGEGTTIGPNTVLRNVRIGERVIIKANSVIEDADIAEGCEVGPFARIRPGTRLEKNAYVGNFVEIKNTEMGEGSKAGHLSYLGDAQVGRGVNVGAATITCNYDGANKHRTIIGDRAFIGSGTQLVAPVTLGEGAYIGAGSTITQDAPADALTVARARQATIPGWVANKPKKEGKR
jgi:bifunctional UDP-N-acetylglucosamine pyrophosphorylase/glucosamine-1-phosphate N-acetyltransferase